MLSRKEKLFLASASIGGGVIFSLNSNLLPLILRDHTSSAFFIGLVIGTAQFLGVIIPPIIGVVSDNMWTKFGRRKPFMLSFIPLTIVMLLAIPFVGNYIELGESSIFIILSLLIILLFTFFNIWNSPYVALLPDLTDPEERGETSGYMQAFNILGTILTFMIAAAIWDKYPLLTFVILAVTIIIFCSITILTVHEKKSITLQEKAHLISILRDFAGEKEFMKFMLTSIFWWFGIGALLAFFILFAKETLSLPESSALIFMGLFTVVLVVSAIPTGMLADKFGKKRMLSVGVILAAIGLLAGAFSSSVTMIYLAMGITALGFGIILVLNFALTADLLPKGKEGEFMGLGNIFSAAPQAAAAPIIGFVISASNNDYRLMFFIAPMMLAIGLISLQYVKITT